MLSERLKKLRKQQGLYQRDIADKINCSVQAISSYEKGTKQPSRETLNKIADFYGVTTDYLLGREEETELPAYIMKIAKDLDSLPDGRKEEIADMVRKLILLGKE